MKKYKVTAYPNWEEWIMEIEAESVEDAIKQANEEVSQNAYFIATEKDVEEIEEVDED